MKFKFKNRQVQNMYNAMESSFKRYYVEYCKGHYHDDRRIFINTYRQLVRLLLVSDKVYGQSSFLNVAIRKAFNMEWNNLAGIRNRFAIIESV